eukprot:8355344-Pyramimonas_sp.AAC.1
MKGRHLAASIQPRFVLRGKPRQTFLWLALVNYDTWHEHPKGELPRIKFCGKMATGQSDLRRFYLREQPVSTWVDQIPPWTTLAKSKGTCK